MAWPPTASVSVDGSLVSPTEVSNAMPPPIMTKMSTVVKTMRMNGLERQQSTADDTNME